MGKINEEEKKESPEILRKLKIKRKQTKEVPKVKSKVQSSVKVIDSEKLEMVATCMKNLEEELEKELQLLGAGEIKKQIRAVKFSGNLELLYKANVWLRTAIKVLVPIFKFKAKQDQKFYEKAKSFAWEEVFSEEQTFLIDYAVHSSYFEHSQFAALRLKDAIVDRFREVGKKRPNVNRDNPDLRIHLHISEEEVNLSLDSSGEPLFKRGYRRESLVAPINECLAAGLIMKTGWCGEEDFFDPMCGSGTIAIEAAMIACNVPPNFNRIRFAFESWKSYDVALFSKILGEAKEQYRPLRSTIFARDVQSNAIRASRVNINTAGMRKSIQLEQADFFKEKSPAQSGLMVMNPPYGERLNVVGSLVSFYGKIGSTLKHEYEGWTAWIFSSEQDAFKNIGLKTDQKISLMNGKLPCQFRQYLMFSGKLSEEKQKKG